MYLRYYIVWVKMSVKYPFYVNNRKLTNKKPPSSSSTVEEIFLDPLIERHIFMMYSYSLRVRTFSPKDRSFFSLFLKINLIFYIILFTS